MQTIITFRHKDGVGIVLPDGSSFAPALVPRLKFVPGFGNVPIQDHDFDELKVVKLSGEQPEPPPKHILAAMDDNVRSHFLAQQAGDVAKQHTENNKIREALRHYEAAGHITIVSDSFLDPIEPKVSSKVAKAAVDEDKVETE